VGVFFENPSKILFGVSISMAIMTVIPIVAMILAIRKKNKNKKSILLH
jgi:hypothetical protein